MCVKKWVVLASVIVAASLPAYGNSSTSISQGLLSSSSESAVIGSRSAAKLEGCLLFRNTLQDVTLNSTGILMAKWDSSRSTEIRDQERTATLPEPNSGIMLSIGLFALIYLGRTRVLVHPN